MTGLFDIVPSTLGNPLDRFMRDFDPVRFNRLRGSIKNEDGQVITTVDVPGFSEDELTVTVQDNILTVRGEAHEEGEKGTFKSEQTFEQSISLPVEVNADTATADLENGTLTITVSEVKKTEGTKVKVNKKNTDSNIEKENTGEF